MKKIRLIVVLLVVTVADAQLLFNLTTMLTSLGKNGSA
jgi:hypothetical protein